jgi:hypothetical protein
MKFILKFERALSLMAVIALVCAIKGFAAAPSINFDQRQGTQNSSIDIKEAEKTNPAPAAQPTPATSKSQGKKSVASAPAANSVSGSGTVSGSGDVAPPCLSDNGPFPIPSSQSASVFLSGTVTVSNGSGVGGNINVSGNMEMSGACFNGESGVLNGNAKVTGTGPVYDSKGNKVGTVTVSGNLSASGFVLGDSISLSKIVVKVSGSY